MRVTIISDASLHADSGAAGYGFWIVSQRGRHGGSGVFKQPTRCSSEAEMMAAINALHVALMMGLAAPGDDVLIQTDSTGAIAHLSGKIRHPNSKVAQRLAPVAKRLHAIRDTHQLRIEFRHVKGHTRGSDARTRAQRHVDKGARTAMRKATKVSQ